MSSLADSNSPPTAVRLLLLVLRFGAVGATCAALNIAIMFVGTVIFERSYVVSALTTFILTIPLSYFLHRKITFQLAQDRKGKTTEFFRFLVYQLVQFAVGLCVLITLVHGMRISPVWATALMSALMFCVSFLMNSTWVFRVFRPKPAVLERSATVSDTRIKLVQVSAFFANHGGGIEVVADRLAQTIAGRGFLVHWIAGGAFKERPEALAAGLTIEQARSIDFVERRLGIPAPIWSFGSLKVLWKAIAGCDVVQVHDFLYVPTLAALCFAGILRKPVVLTQHIGRITFRSGFAKTTVFLLHRTIGRLVMRLASQVVFIGGPVMQYFQRFSDFRNPPLFIANGLDHAVYRPSTVLRTSSGPLRCLFVGRFVKKKGLALLRRCIDLPDTHWTFVGWGPMSPANWGPLPANVEVLEGLKAGEVVRHYQTADLLVLPSTGEGFPLVLQESLACGTPVLISGEIAEAFPAIDPQCTFIVELRSANAAERLRDRLKKLAQERLTAVSRQHAAALAQQWSWEGCVDQYCAIYTGLVRSSDGKSKAAK